MITVIADDITGAAEIAGVCLRYGLKVSFGIDTVPKDEADVKIIATDSRSATESDAYNIHKKLTEEIYQNHDSLVFKKCDSVLRGYVLTELSAILDVNGRDYVLLQPSNPLSGRCIKNGEYYISDVKIENTGFSNDPDFPTTESTVNSILLQRSTIQNTEKKIYVGNINKITNSGVYIPDCSSIDDLVKSCELAQENILLCGSAAFFEQILIYKGHKTKLAANDLISSPKEFLLISGSIHPESRIFIEKMKNRNIPVVGFPENLIQKKVKEESINQWVKVLSEIWHKNKTLILTISESKISFFDSSTILNERMALAVQLLLKTCKISEILITGGATAYSLLTTLGWAVLDPIEEFAPGVVRMKVHNSEIFLILKPGSYSWAEKQFQ